MQRILAEIVDVKKFASNKVNGQTFSDYLLKVKFKDAACKGYVLPPRVKGRVHSILRTYPYLSRPRIGDEIILAPHEVRGFLHPLRIEPVIVAPEPTELRFKLVLHNPERRRYDYRVILPRSEREMAGSLIEEEEVAASIPRTIGYGCHPIKARCGSWSTRAVIPIVTPRRVYSYTIDVNGDGLEERIVENEFLRVSFAPHLGARVESVWLKNSPSDLLGRTFEYGKDGYVDYGGCADHIGEFPGDFWKTKFAEEWSGSSAVFSHSSKGFQIDKRVRLLPSLPLVHHAVRIRWNGRAEKDILCWHRIAVALDDPPSASVVYIQTEEKPERIRYTPPAGWWRDEKDYYGLKYGAVIYSHESGKRVFSFVTDPDAIEFLQCVSVKGLQLVAPYFRRRKLKSHEEIKLHYAYIVGEDFLLDSEACFIASTTPWYKGRRYLAIMGKTGQPLETLKARISTGESITLFPKRLTGVGRFLCARKELRFREAARVTFRIGGRQHSLKLREA
jgi:hypothetical protein